MKTDKRLLLLNGNDNILVCCQSLPSGQAIALEGHRLILPDPVDLGHKLARRAIEKGERIIRYGVSIGSATEKIKTGEHVHLHNMKSDYIAVHTREWQMDPEHHEEEI